MTDGETASDITSFVTYGASHLTVLAIFVTACLILVAVGRRLRGAPSLVFFNRGFALIILAIMLPLNATLWLPSRWDVTISFPFDLCDLAWMAAVAALWSGRATMFYGALYYWGLTLTTQGLITPDLPQDFPHIYFTMFFTSHCLTPMAAVYLTWGVGLRPTWKLMWTTVGLTVFWGLCMLVFNTFTGSNYLYMNAKPPSGSVLDLLGPWPFYLASELALGITVWFIITWPWNVGRERSQVTRLSYLGFHEDVLSG